MHKNELNGHLAHFFFIATSASYFLELEVDERLNIAGLYLDYHHNQHN